LSNGERVIGLIYSTLRCTSNGLNIHTKGAEPGVPNANNTTERMSTAKNGKKRRQSLKRTLYHVFSNVNTCSRKTVKSTFRDKIPLL